MCPLPQTGSAQGPSFFSSRGCSYSSTLRVEVGSKVCVLILWSCFQVIMPDPSAKSTQFFEVSCLPLINLYYLLFDDIDKSPGHDSSFADLEPGWLSRTPILTWSWHLGAVWTCCNARCYFFTSFFIQLLTAPNFSRKDSTLNPWIQPSNYHHLSFHYFPSAFSSILRVISKGHTEIICNESGH